MRNISVTLTKDQITAKSKRVTRRNGWRNLKVGELLCTVEKSQGLKKGESLKRLRVIRVTDLKTEPLGRLLDDPVYGAEECRLEGFPDLTPAAFADMFMRTHKGVTLETPVTRIAFEYPFCGGAIAFWQTHYHHVLSVCHAPEVDEDADAEMISEWWSKPHPTARSAFEAHFQTWPYYPCLDFSDSSKFFELGAPND